MADSMRDTVHEISIALTLDDGDFAEKASEAADEAAEAITSTMANAMEDVSTEVTDSANDIQSQIDGILKDTELSARSQVMKIATLYRQMGQEQSEALKSAWEHIDRGTSSVKKLGDETKKTGLGKLLKSVKDVGKSTGETSKEVDKLRRETEKVSKAQKKNIGIMDQMTSCAKKLRTALVGAFAVKSIVNFGKNCMDLGSDLTEVQNVVDTTFPHMTEQIDAFAKDAAKQFGLSETMAKRYTGTFGSMAEAFGFTEKQAADMSTTLTGLAGDVASFYNIGQDAAYTKLKSVFSGETESLKDLGIVMTQTALDSYALANGFGKTTAQMSEMEKVALRYSFVQSQLTNATGDFAKTAGGSWANQVRIFRLQLDSLRATIGQGLINVFMPVIKVINALMGRLASLTNMFKSFTEMIFGDAAGGGESSNPVAAMAADMSDDLSNAAGAADSLADSTSGVGEAAKKAAKEMQALMGFDEINKLADNSDDDSDSTVPASGGGGIDVGSTGVDFGGLSAGKSILDKMDESASKMFNTFKRLSDLFKKGFKIGFGDSARTIDEIKWHLDSIKASLLKIVRDDGVTAAFKRMLESMALNAGKVAGSFASIGLTIADNLLGGINRYLQQDGPDIKKRLASIFNTTTEISDTVGDYMVALQDIFSVFRSADAKQCTADIISMFSTGFFGALDLGLRFASDMLTRVTQPITDNVEAIKLAITNTLAPIRTVLDTLRQSTEDTFSKMSEVYDQHIGPMLQSFTDGFSGLAGHMLERYNTDIAPVLQNLADKFADVWEGHVQPAINAFLDLAGSVADNVTQIWEQTIKPFTDWIIDTVSPILAPAIEALGSTALDTFGSFADAVHAAFDKLGEFFDRVTEGIPTAETLIGRMESLHDWLKKHETALGVVAIAMGGFTAAIAAHTIAANAATIAQTAASVAAGIWNGVAGIGTAVTTAFGAAMAFLTSPITLVIAAITAVIAVGYLLYKNWDTIKAAAIDTWDSIRLNIQNAIDRMKETFHNFMLFIGGFWENLKTKFSDIGTKIGETVSGAIKGVINAIFADIEGRVNGFIGMINGAVGVINKIPGVNLGTISEVSLPRLAQGGYVKANTPQLAVIGDNKHQGEVVAPEGKLREMAAQAAAGGGNAEVIALLKAILTYLEDHDLVEIDPESIRKYMIKVTNQRTKATGRCELVF